MTYKERERYRILVAVQEKTITQIKGAEILNLSVRQIRNLLKNFDKTNPKNLISKKRGKASNRSYCPSFKEKILKIICRHYEDFGPTLIKEKLWEHHQIKVSNETIRSWMTQANLWIPKQKRKKVHRLRERRKCFGELIQADGSHHDWFEGRRKKCVLIVFVDDATSQITSLYFAEGESLEAYFYALEKHIKRLGIPRQIYSDRLSVFESCKEDNITHFKYALNCLEIAHTTATTPQAKGRVERTNKTLQDRLIKEMRIRGISTIEEANVYAQEYMEMHNKKFSKEPKSTFNAHRPLETDLSRILCRYEERTVLNDLSIQFHNKFYQICEDIPKKTKIEVRKQLDGTIRLFFKNKELTYRVYEGSHRDKNKRIEHLEDKRKLAKNSSHPWKRASFERFIKEKENMAWEDNFEDVI